MVVSHFYSKRVWSQQEDRNKSVIHRWHDGIRPFNTTNCTFVKHSDDVIVGITLMIYSELHFMESPVRNRK